MFLNSRSKTSGNNKAIFFIHGNSSSSSSFKKLMEGLSEAYDQIAFDLPGHGKSPRSESNYPFENITQIICKQVNNYKYETVFLIGHSLGGHFILHALPQIRNLKGIFIFGTPPLSSTDSINQAFLPNPNFPYLVTNQLEDAQMMSLAKDLTSEKNLSQVLSDLRNTDGLFREIVGSEMASKETIDEVSYLKKSQTPVCIAHGKNDKFVNLDYIRTIKGIKLFQDKVHIIDSSHYLQLDAPNELRDLINEFVKMTDD